MPDATLYVTDLARDALFDRVWQRSRRDRGFQGRFVRGDRCRTRAALFDEVSAALQFPFYFGCNWDAFDECLSDLDWIEADDLLVVIVDGGELLRAEPSDLPLLLGAIRSAAGEPRPGRTVRFAAQFGGVPDEAMRRAIDRAGLGPRDLSGVL